jgi:hypothetical protein
MEQQKRTAFWVLTLRSWEKPGDSEGRKLSQARNQQKQVTDDMFLRNVGPSPNYASL